MVKKKLLIEITFEEEHEFLDEDPYLKLKKMKVHPKSDILTDSESQTIGEHMAQSDWWQVNFWIDLQEIISQSVLKKKY